MGSISKVCIGPVTAMAGLQSEASPIYVMKDLSPVEERLGGQCLHILVIEG